MHIVTFKAHAKINWSLSVTGKRDDGYHELDMLLQSVTMHDFITVSIQRSKGIDLLCSRPLGDIENNLAFKAANAFFQHTEILPDCRIYLHKYIPVCAGMGGGSADAAAVLTALNRLYGSPLRRTELSELALSLGADVPFLLQGGLARAQGIGEQLTFFPNKHRFYFVGIMPRRGASTRKVFSLFDDSLPRRPVNNDALLHAILHGDPADAAKHMHNHLQPVTESLLPQLTELRAALLRFGALTSVMTGSGALMYGLFASAEAADSAYAALRKAGYGRVFRFDSCECGIETP